MQNIVDEIVIWSVHHGYILINNNKISFLGQKLVRSVYGISIRLIINFWTEPAMLINNSISFLDWNEVSNRQIQHQGKWTLLVFVSISWLFLKKFYFDWSAVHKTWLFFFCVKFVSQTNSFAYVLTIPFWTVNSHFERLSPVLPFDLEISHFEGNICKFSILSKNSSMYCKLLCLLVF